ncbi:MAG: hypothetical protein HC876_19175 [Chloroflexaceae bacterium]|nr:hypothetical protein [Chloroflexaceae bacterium]NJO07458.1 hypothetical protein [Chloroflexaceae bacterium]
MRDTPATAIQCEHCGTVLAQSTPDAVGLIIQRIVVYPRARVQMVCPVCERRRAWYPPQQGRRRGKL